jgi:hypothetical protein
MSANSANQSTDAENSKAVPPCTPIDDDVKVSSLGSIQEIARSRIRLGEEHSRGTHDCDPSRVSY